MDYKIFLGGTCADSKWRDDLLSVIQVDSFNPVVKSWTPDCIFEENKQKDLLCNVHLYVITSEMKGVYSIAEAIESSCNPNIVTILHIIPDGFNDGELKSLQATSDMCKMHGGISYIDSDLHRTARVINNCFR